MPRTSRQASPPHHPKNVNKTLLKVDLRYSTTSWQCADTRGQPSACGICPLERAAQLPALCSRYGCGAILALAATLTIRGNAQRASVTVGDLQHVGMPAFWKKYCRYSPQMLEASKVQKPVDSCTRKFSINRPARDERR